MSQSAVDTITIAAIATPPGRGGVGIVRVSGPKVRAIAEAVAGELPPPRHASFRDFLDADGRVIDQGLVLYFPAPRSFTGEDVLELQGHGGPVVMDLLLRRVLGLGARLARPGEFSERAFLNDRLDLAQAEAVADLIDAETEAAARLATRSLQGEFSRRIQALQEKLVELRVYVEAALDFPEEEIDFLADGQVQARLAAVIEAVAAVRAGAANGRLLREGINLVIAGRPNAGKSSLLNALAGTEAAIVTAVPGTTRDVLRERIALDGVPVHLIDTAGLRETDDEVEREGVRRARAEIERADRVLWVYDAGAGRPDLDEILSGLPSGVPVTLVRNKVDLVGEAPALDEYQGLPQVALSARHGQGLELLRRHLLEGAGYHAGSEGQFLARRRHLDAIDRALAALQRGAEVLQATAAGELLAEELRLAHQALGEITGEFTADDLLGEIFSSFCIGK